MRGRRGHVLLMLTHRALRSMGPSEGEGGRRGSSYGICLLRCC